MRRKRESLEIIHDILKAIQEKGDYVKPTHILYKSNLSHQMLTDYLKDLIKKGFIIEEPVEKGKKYSLTTKGYNYLKDYSVINSFIESYGLQ